MKIEEIMATVLDDEAYRSFGISFGAEYAALVAKKQTSALEQAGFQIVPIEPTEEMLSPFIEKWVDTEGFGWSVQAKKAYKTYKTMLAQAKKEQENG